MTRRVVSILLSLLLLCVFCEDATAQRTSAQHGSSGRYNPRLTATDTVYAANGVEFNLHWNQLAFDLFGNVPAVFDAKSDSGSIVTGGYRFTPDNATGGAFSVDIEAFDYNGSGIGQKTTMVRTEHDSTGINTANYLIIGDSMTAASGNSYWVVALDSLLTAGGDAPDFTGTQGSSPNEHEGRSGWHYYAFGTDFPDNPFWNTDHVDLQNYISTNSFKDPDYIIIALGGNDTYYKLNGDYYSSVSDIIAYADTLVTAARDADTGYPNAEIIIVPSPLGSTPVAYGYGYDADNDCDWISWRKDLLDFTERIIETYDKGATASNISVCLPGLWLDRENSYYYSTTTARSARDVTEIKAGTNYRHPNLIGYNQVADAVYSHIRCTRPTPVNLLTASEDFGNAAWVVTAEATVTGSKSDPFGGTSAEEVANTDGGGAYASVSHTAMPLSEDSYVVSGYIAGISGQDNSTFITLRNNTHVADHDIVLDIASDGVITYASSALVSDYDLIDIGAAGGWYYFWFSVDTSAVTGDECRVRFYPWNASTTTGDGCTMYGLQLEPGTTPGDLLLKP